MNLSAERPISNFFVVGINFRKADAAIRGQFSINEYQYGAILDRATDYNLSGLFILSTCNRTEVYGIADNAEQLISLLCTQTEGSVQTFCKLAYIKNGIEAVEHLFHVGAGLDSQLLGDYEIVGQLKLALKFSKDRGHLNCFLERLSNTVLQASKAIKTETSFSNGAVSLSFTAVQYLKNNTTSKNNEKILIVGLGKMGSNVAKNLVDYLGAQNIILINRSAQKAVSLATELNLSHSGLDQLAFHIETAAIIFVATHAAEPVILRSQLEGKGEKLIIDLSLPANVEASCGDLPGISLVNVDKLAQRKDCTLKKRESEIPRVKAIIKKYLADFVQWQNARKDAIVLKAIKQKLQEIHIKELLKINWG